ncbi:MAG: hypothetical protein Q8M07_29065 [Prosthecobacter sp.]|nr:hypothetical protein [Prosthecobacter sp.]
MPEFITRSRTPSDLKWLLNERAGLNGDADELRKQVARGRARLAKAEAQVELLRLEVAATEAQQASRLNELEAFDRVIASAYPGVRPHAAGSIVTWAGAHGKRGDLKKFVLELLRTAAPRALRTGEVFAAVVTKFELRLTTREKAKVRCNLRKLLARAEAVVEHLPPERHSDLGSWRWRPMPALDVLAGASRDCPAANPLRAEVGCQRAGRSHG